jgi:hypothetical protein
VFAGSFLIGFFYGFGAPLYYTFDLNYHILFGGIPETFRNSFSAVKFFFEANWNSYFSYLEDARNSRF